MTPFGRGYFIVDKVVFSEDSAIKWKKFQSDPDTYYYCKEVEE